MRFLLAILPQSIPNAIEPDILCFDAVFLKYFPPHRLLRRLAEFHRPRTGVPTTDFVSAMFAPLVHEEISLPIMTEEDTGHADEINPFPQIESFRFHNLSIFRDFFMDAPKRLRMSQYFMVTMRRNLHVLRSFQITARLRPEVSVRNSTNRNNVLIHIRF